MIKLCLKFLNALGFSGQDVHMLSAGQGGKIAGAIVCPYPIQVVNNPANRKLTVPCLLPNQDMLIHIPILMRPVVGRMKYHIITLLNLASALPKGVIRTLALLAHYPTHALLASFRTPANERFFAHRARLDFATCGVGVAYRIEPARNAESTNALPYSPYCSAAVFTLDIHAYMVP